MVDSIIDKEMPAHQLAALCMSIYFQNMSAQETATLAEEMMLSGEVVDLSKITKPKIDKYSTGGVGDKTSLVLIPLAAACGVVMPNMNGVDEEFVISNLDKLSAIPGFSPNMDLKKFVGQLGDVGCVMSEQRSEIAPVDEIIYQMRQLTATIPSLPLITASVLSRKLAQGRGGARGRCKVGQTDHLSKTWSKPSSSPAPSPRVGRSMKRRCVALVTDMNQPLGDTVGTALEIKEAIKLLKGEGTERPAGTRAQARHGDCSPRRCGRFHAFGQADGPARPRRRGRLREIQGDDRCPRRKDGLPGRSLEIPRSQVCAQAARPQARIRAYHQRGHDRPRGAVALPRRNAGASSIPPSASRKSKRSARK